MPHGQRYVRLVELGTIYKGRLTTASVLLLRAAAAEIVRARGCDERKTDRDTGRSSSGESLDAMVPRFRLNGTIET